MAKAKYRDRLTAERLRQALDYAPGTGIFTWKQPPRGAKVGDVAGAPDRKPGGYIRIRIDGHQIYAHCLAWLWMTGAWPRDQVDHRNTIRDDNRWSNLREATFALNSQNRRRASRNNGTGLLGVSLRTDRKRIKKYNARITLNRKTIDLGCFATSDEAHAAYVAAKRQLHPRGAL